MTLHDAELAMRVVTIGATALLCALLRKLTGWRSWVPPFAMLSAFQPLFEARPGARPSSTVVVAALALWIIALAARGPRRVALRCFAIVASGMAAISPWLFP